jgi:hypothetical protein
MNGSILPRTIEPVSRTRQRLGVASRDRGGAGGARLPLLLALCLALAAPAAGVRAQGSAPTEPHGRAIEALRAALRSADAAPLEPFLAADYRLGDYEGAAARAILRRTLAGGQELPRDLRVDSARAEGTHRRLFATFAFPAGSVRQDMLVSGDGLFLEINLFAARRPAVRAFPDDRIAGPARTEVPMVRRGGLVLVEADADGVRGWFVLDTGAPRLVLDRPAGERSQGRRIGAFRIADLEFRQVDALHMDLRRLRESTGLDVRGLLGYEVLAPFELELDYRRGRLTLHRLDPRGGRLDGSAGPAGGGIPFELVGHLPVVALEVAGRTLRLGVDTGAEGSVLVPSLQPQLAGSFRRLGSLDVRGASGTTAAAPMGDLADARLAGRALAPMAVVFAPIPDLELAGSGLSGLLGYPLLADRTVRINYRTRRLHLSD